MKKGVYLKAAKLIAEGKTDFACLAINKVVGPFSKERAKFDCYFYDPTTPLYKQYTWFGDTTKRNQLARTLALLLMHEMEKDGSL